MEATISPSDVPGTMSFWHGGDLDEREGRIVHKGGRAEYGPGLYLTSNYSTAKMYAKGSKKLYMVVVQQGNDMEDVRFPEENAKLFVMANVMANKRKAVLEQVMKWMNEGSVSANLFNNIMINEGAIKTSDQHKLRQFYVDNGVDYLITGNILHNGRMMVLFNMDKIVSVKRVMPNDTIEVFEFP